MNGGTNFLRLIRTGQLTDDVNNKIPPIFIRLVEVIIILAVMYGGFRVTINNLQSDVSVLRDTVGTSKNTENLCERTVALETRWEGIEKTLKRIENKIDKKNEGGNNE